VGGVFGLQKGGLFMGILPVISKPPPHTFPLECHLSLQRGVGLIANAASSPSEATWITAGKSQVVPTLVHPFVESSSPS
jgi:hypothetical protein